MISFDKATLELLSNFVSINPSIEFIKGKNISTISTTDSMYASGELNVKIPRDFAIYDLAKLLNFIDMFGLDEHLIDIQENRLIVKTKDPKSNQHFVCHYANRNLIKIPDHNQYPELPSIDAEFPLNKTHLQQLLKAVNFVGVTDLVIKSDINNIVLTGTNTRDSSSDSYSFDIKSTIKCKKFDCSIKVEDLKILIDDYNVKISNQGSIQFSGSKKQIYFIGVQV